ncbi:MAG: bifunctional 2-polyprenyl-6-hydroxyphenol methylase/3-demethylubiquinol 3-O-methyltransferase UbiG [Hyphomicrobiaceae bacterium]|nr:bifunctional 2-polyprenyl-6-hydroxyphenol methylase/3-demethylubiquinol 3-O-methyltransferase UbiG [Hyphomicrobiaceae bacterium]
MSDPSAASVNPDEVARFSALAAEWWNPKGKFGVLHKFNPVRLGYIRDHVCTRFDRDPRAMRPFEGLRFLDIGCGGGLLSEPVARLGADLVSVDPSVENIKTASVHAEEQGLAIDFRASTAEALADAGERFDVVLNMEVVEHVNDMPAYVGRCAQMVKPGGLMFVATINRTRKAWAMAIVGAERILGWLPVGTHTYEMLVRPDELVAALDAGGLAVQDMTGVVYDVLTGQWKPSADTDVNYMLVSGRD